MVAVASRHIGPRLVALGFHLAALLPLTAMTLGAGALAHISLGELAGFAGLGLVGWLSYLTFYTAIDIGPISLVSPIVSGYAAFTVLLAVAIGGEHLSVLELVAVVATISGVVAASVEAGAKAHREVDRRALRGIALGVLAMVCFGGFIYGVTYRRPGVSWLGALFLARGFTGLLFAAQCGRERRTWPPVSRRLVGIVALLGMLDTAGYVLFDIGERHGGTAVVAAASAPYSLVPVVVGVWLWGERVKSQQLVGLGLVCGGLILLGASS